jgi:hypothetical protein
MSGQLLLEETGERYAAKGGAPCRHVACHKFKVVGMIAPSSAPRSAHWLVATGVINGSLRS